jgi:hypothetical protein
VTPAKQGHSHHWQSSKAYTGLSLGFQTTVTSVITSQNYAGNKQKSYKIMRMNMFAAQGTAKPTMGLKLGGG